MGLADCVPQNKLLISRSPPWIKHRDQVIANVNSRPRASHSIAADESVSDQAGRGGESTWNEPGMNMLMNGGFEICWWGLLLRLILMASSSAWPSPSRKCWTLPEKPFSTILAAGGNIFQCVPVTREEFIHPSTGNGYAKHSIDFITNHKWLVITEIRPDSSSTILATLFILWIFFLK